MSVGVKTHMFFLRLERAELCQQRDEGSSEGNSELSALQR